MRYSNHGRTAGGSRMNGPVDRVYHFAEDSHQASHVSPNLRSRKNRNRTGSGGSLEYTSGSGSHSHSYDTIDGSLHNKPLPPPPGLKNVGNTCYANAALQCLLSTALPHALLDERNAHIIRRHSFNRKLLVHGSGSVNSDDDTNSADGTYGSCLSGMTGIYGGLSVDDDDEEEDDVILARAMGEERDSDALKGLRASPSRKGRRKRFAKKQQGDDATVESASTLYSDMYQVMKRRQQKEDPDTDADLLCAWLTQELTQITREYTTPPQGFKAEKRRSKSAGSGRGTSPTNFLGAFFGSSSPGSDAAHNRVVDPGSITRHVHKISPCLRPYQQEDAHEFFRSLLSSLTMHGQNARLSSLFDGLLESSVTCQTCRKTSLTRDRYMDLSLDIADQSVTTLERALEKFTEEETLCHDNMVTCSRCKVKRVVTKGLRLATAPTMLVINFKRFAYDNYGRLSRLSKQVHFPLKLEMKDYMSKANRGKPPPYTLVAVLVHRGRSCDCGHYFAYVRKGKDWYLANDAEVTKVDIETVLQAQAYVLVYEVAGMKEKHNFDCYSRYHRSLDEEDEETMARERRDDGETSPSWDFSSLSSLLEACDATLCGAMNNVVDTSSQAKSKHSFEDDSPQRKGSSESSKTHRRDTIDDLGAPDHKKDSTDKVKAHFKRGRSHTPSRDNRSRAYQESMSREREVRSSMRDYEPPDSLPRRAKSLSRAGREESSEHQSRKKNRSKPKPSRKRVPSKPRSGGPSSSGQELPPLHETLSGSSTGGVMHDVSG